MEKYHSRVELLIDACCPENLTEVEHDGLTPLVVALINEAPDDIIHLLLNRGPQAARMKDFHSSYPLHHMYRRDLRIQSQIYSLYPEAIHKLDKFGRTPLHCACISPDPTVEEMRFLVERSIGCIILDTDDDTPYDIALSCSLEETEKQVVLDYMAMATKDTVCAMIEAILHPKTIAPLAVIQHMRVIITTLLPANVTIDSMSNQRLLQLIRPLLNPVTIKTLLRNDHLQRLHKEDEYYQMWICSLQWMNKTNRYYYKNDPFDKLAGIHVLDSVANTVECMFLHLQENPMLCDRKISTTQKKNLGRKRKSRS
jgi:ankyrin repeat protein